MNQSTLINSCPEYNSRISKDSSYTSTQKSTHPSAPPLDPSSPPPSYNELYPTYTQIEDFRTKCYDDSRKWKDQGKTFREFLNSLPKMIQSLNNTGDSSRSSRVQSEERSNFSDNSKVFYMGSTTGNTTVIDNSKTNIGDKDSSDKPSSFLVLCTACIFLTFIFQSFYYLYMSRNSDLRKSKSYFQKSLISSLSSISFACLCLSFIFGLLVKNPQQYCGVNGADWALLTFIVIIVSTSIVVSSVASVFISADNLNAKQKIDEKIDDMYQVPDIRNKVQEKSFWETSSIFLTEFNIFAYSRIPSEQK